MARALGSTHARTRTVIICVIYNDPSSYCAVWSVLKPTSGFPILSSSQAESTADRQDITPSLDHLFPEPLTPPRLGWRTVYSSLPVHSVCHFGTPFPRMLCYCITNTGQWGNLNLRPLILQSKALPLIFSLPSRMMCRLLYRTMLSICPERAW